MEFNLARRPGKTYGKTNRNARVHNLYDDHASRSDASGATPPDLSPSPSTNLYLNDDSKDNAKSQRHSRPKPGATHLDRQDSSGVRHGTGPLTETHTTVDLYDIGSSDEDTTENQLGNRDAKRRRTTKPLRKTEPRPVLQPSLASKSENLPVRKGQSKKKSDTAAKETTSTRLVNKAAGVQPAARVPESAAAPHKSHSKSGRSVKTQNGLRVHKSPSPQTGLLPGETDVAMIDQSTVAPVEYPSDHSLRSIASDGVTPKRKRMSYTDLGSGTPSPSHLGMTSLKLTTPASPLKVSSEPSSDEEVARKTTRRRLIDRLDAPPKSTEPAIEDHVSDTPLATISAQASKTGGARRKASKLQSKPDEGFNIAPTLDGSQSSQTRGSWAAKTRTTYASQRSHLSDMVDQLDALDGPSSQQSVEDVLLRITTTQAASQLELEDEESDETGGGGKLKSIHELRQSGANKRFDREIDALLEDVDAVEHSSKALRLQALMKIIRRLREASFLRHFAGSGRVQRLTSLAAGPVDMPTSILLAAMFSMLIEAEDVGLNSLTLIFGAMLNLAAAMLDESRQFVKIIKDRKENLSRALVHDLVEFERDLDSSQDLRLVHGHIYPDLTALSCLEATLRKTVPFGDASTKLTAPMYTRLLDLLEMHARDLPNDPSDQLSLVKIETSLSLLELCSVVIDNSSLHVLDGKYQTLGDALAPIMELENSQQEPFEQSVLRVVVSLSNNKPRMCHLFGKTAITNNAFNIIDQHFQRLSDQAERQQALDQGKLDSVVLALGCLLNFAELDESLRTRLSKMGAGKDNHVAQLVSLFNTQVSKVDEATTDEQSQVLVAFGYLSMLLCTLSLNTVIRGQITRLLVNKSFEDLCKAAETFFSHFRTLEAISGDDASLSTFTARFNAILGTIRSSSI